MNKQSTTSREQRSRSNLMKRASYISLGIVFLAIVGLLPLVHHHYKTQEIAKAVINGSRPVKISGIHIFGQQMDIHCKEQAVLYLSNCLNRPRVEVHGGMTYTIDMTTADGVTFRTMGYVRPGGYLTLGQTDGEDLGCGIDLGTQKPSAIDRLLERLAAPVPGTSEWF